MGQSSSSSSLFSRSTLTGSHVDQDYDDHGEDDGNDNDDEALEGQPEDKVEASHDNRGRSDTYWADALPVGAAAASLQQHEQSSLTMAAAQTAASRAGS